MKTDFSYRIYGMFALILPESPSGEKAMGQVMEMTDGTAHEKGNHATHYDI